MRSPVMPIDAAFGGAQTREHNAFKVQLGKETLAYDSGSSSGSAAQVIQLTNTTEVACWIP